MNGNDQCQCVLFKKVGIQFLSVNTSWKIDRYFPTRSDVNTNAILKGISIADDQVSLNGLTNSNLIRIAIGHHPLKGEGQLVDQGFLDNLANAGFKLYLHGHSHTVAANLSSQLFGYGIWTIGAGTLNAAATNRPESTPRMYHIITIHNDYSTISIKSLEKKNDSLPWQDAYIWKPDGASKPASPECIISL